MGFLALALGALGCSPWVTLPSTPSPAPRPAVVPELRAGTGRADITPPPGLGLAGHGPEGRRAAGYRQRLYARALVLEDAGGERIAIVGVDLGFSSAALHRMAAAKLDGTGIGADRLILAATHTHSAPSHYFDGFTFNLLASHKVGYDRRVVDFLAERIASAVVQAASELKAARATWGSTDLWGFTRNRSIEAAELNPGGSMFPGAPAGLPRDMQAVNPAWTMLRIDVRDAPTSPFRPAAALSVFAMHATGNTSGEQLYDADLFGIVERSVERHMDRFNGAGLTAPPSSVHLVLSGPAGDVSPAFPQDSRCPAGRGLSDAREPADALARCLGAARAFVSRAGNALGESAIRLFVELGQSPPEEVRIARLFRTVPAGSVPEWCPDPRAGTPLVGGAEDGRTRFHNHSLPLSGVAAEGTVTGQGSPGCHREKRLFLGSLQTLLADGGGVPRTLQLALIRIGPTVLAAAPFELTTATGLRISTAVRHAIGGDAAGVRRVVVVAHANGYLSYVATPEEYRLQFYEGASTLYGPHTASVLAHLFADMAEALARGEPAPPDQGVPPFRVRPGRRSQRPMADATEGPPVVARSVARTVCQGDTLVAEWVDLYPGRVHAAGVPVLRIDRRDGGAVEAVTWDDNPALEVRPQRSLRSRGYLWQMRWTPRWTGAEYRVVLLARPDHEERTGEWVTGCGSA